MVSAPPATLCILWCVAARLVTAGPPPVPRSCSCRRGFHGSNPRSSRTSSSSIHHRPRRRRCKRWRGDDAWHSRLASRRWRRRWGRTALNASTCAASDAFEGPGPGQREEGAGFLNVQPFRTSERIREGDEPHGKSTYVSYLRGNGASTSCSFGIAMSPRGLRTARCHMYPLVRCSAACHSGAPPRACGTYSAVRHPVSSPTTRQSTLPGLTRGASSMRLHRIGGE